MLYSLRNPFLKVSGALMVQRLSKERGGKELSLATVFNISFSFSRIIREPRSSRRAHAHYAS